MVFSLVSLPLLTVKALLMKDPPAFLHGLLWQCLCFELQYSLTVTQVAVCTKVLPPQQLNKSPDASRHHLRKFTNALIGPVYFKLSFLSSSIGAIALLIAGLLVFDTNVVGFYYGQH